MNEHAYPRNELGPAPLAGRADPVAGVPGAPGAAKPTITKTSLATCTASALSSQDFAAIEALVLTLSATDRQHLAAILAALAVVAEADLTPKEAAFRLGLSPSTVRGRCAAGCLGRRVGGRWRIPAAEVRALLEGGRHA